MIRSAWERSVCDRICSYNTVPMPGRASLAMVPGRVRESSNVVIGEVPASAVDAYRRHAVFQAHLGKGGERDAHHEETNRTRFHIEISLHEESSAPWMNLRRVMPFAVTTVDLGQTTRCESSVEALNGKIS